MGKDLLLKVSERFLWEQAMDLNFRGSRRTQKCLSSPVMLSFVSSFEYDHLNDDADAWWKHRP